MFLIGDIMDLEQTAACMAELGHVTRLAVYRHLVTAGEGGLAVGEIQKKLEIPASTLSHHLSHLSRVGLIVQKRDGRTLYCIAQYAKLQGMVDFLVDECCDGKACISSTKCCD